MELKLINFKISKYLIPFIYLIFSIIFIVNSKIGGGGSSSSSSSKGSSSSWLRFGAESCIQDCISVKSNAFYCTDGRDFGWCCYDSSRVEC